MVNIDAWGHRKNPQGRQVQDEPRDPGMILQIVHLRDKSNLCWREIGERFGITRQGAFQLHKRWHKWAKGYRHGS
jgi:hypothetical protein